MLGRSNKSKLADVIGELEALGSSESLEGMGRYGIRLDNALGISVAQIRKVAKQLGRDHELARQLWDTRIHEARILACMIDDPGDVDEEQLETWVMDFDSWDLCDLCCANLFDRIPNAYEKAIEWCGRDEEFVKRAGFAMIAVLAVHDKKAEDRRFTELLPIIIKESTDKRNYVKKAINWALRQIGKRNLPLNQAAIEAAEQIADKDSNSARWVASDALRELTAEKVQNRLNRT